MQFRVCRVCLCECVCVCNFVCAGQLCLCSLTALAQSSALVAGPHEWVYLASEASKQTRTLSLSCLCSLAALAQLSTLINALPVHLSDRFFAAGVADGMADGVADFLWTPFFDDSFAFGSHPQQ